MAQACGKRKNKPRYTLQLTDRIEREKSRVRKTEREHLYIVALLYDAHKTATQQRNNAKTQNMRDKDLVTMNKCRRSVCKCRLSIEKCALTQTMWKSQCVCVRCEVLPGYDSDEEKSSIKWRASIES